MQTFDLFDANEQLGTKGLLTTAAARLFYQHGYTRVTIDDICASATGSFTKGAFYHFFKSKEGILFAINVAYLEHSVSLVTSFDAHLPADRKFHLLAQNSARLLMEKRQFVVVANQEIRFLTAEYRIIVLKLRKDLRHAIESIIRQGQREGLFMVELDPKIVTMNYFGMLNWIYAWFRPEGAWDASHVIDAFEGQFLRGILSRNLDRETPPPRRD